MSFSVRNERSGLEYNGTSLNSLFAQRRNLRAAVVPAHGARDPALQPRGAAPARRATATRSTLGDYLRRAALLAPFLDDYLLPMGAAIWSPDPQRCCAFPARFLVRFMHNHGMLTRRRPPGWRVITRRLGALCRAARRAVAPPHPPATAPVRRRCAAPPTACGSSARGGRPSASTTCSSPATPTRRCALLADPSRAEREILGALPLPAQRSRAAHRHVAAAAAAPGLGGVELPRARREPEQRVALTYNMNILQGLRVAPHVLRHAQPLRRDRPARASSQRIAYAPSAVHARRRRRAAAPRTRSAACAARTTAAPTGATASTKTASSARCARAARFERGRTMHSAIYRGWLEHRRMAPRRHAFRYPLFMLYLDLAELDRRVRAAAGCGRRGARRWRASTGATTSATPAGRSTSRCASWWPSASAPPARARSACSRTCAISATCSIRSASTTASTRPATRVETIVAEVNNTPWGERHATCSTARRQRATARVLHWASPRRFTSRRSIPWRSTTTGALARRASTLARAHGTDCADDGADRGRSTPRWCCSARRSTRATLARTLLRFPLMTLQVIAGIHWQALRLWLQARARA